MKNCLVCNRLMKQNKKEIQNLVKECLGHEEHIIHNALGGRLKAYGVLCIDCGGTVNDTIDSAFIKLFSVYTTRMDKLMKRDRPPTSKLFVNGYHNKLDFPIKLENGVLVPNTKDKKYDETTNILHVYAHENIIANYEKFALKEAKEEFGLEDCEVVRHVSFEPSNEIELYFSKGNESFNSQMAKGITKIAVEYAYHKGIDRKSLKHHIDFENKTFKECNSIYMFSPPNNVLLLLDYFRDQLDENYPNHAVMLYTIDFDSRTRNLYCYIELFGTFQYYVLLKEDYKGPEVNESFAQRISPKPRANYRLDNMEYKELYCFAKEHNIDISTVEFGSNLDILKSYIEKKVNSKPNEYVYDFKNNINDQIRNVINRIIARALYNDIDCELTEYIEKLPSLEKISLLIKLRQMISEPDSELQVYRQKLINEDMAICSMADEIAEAYETNQRPSIEFGHFKAQMLDYYLSLF